jgi:hypothetical protein
MNYTLGRNTTTETLRGEANSYGLDMHFGQIVENWLTRCPKEGALTRHSKAFGIAVGFSKYRKPLPVRCLAA